MLCCPSPSCPLCARRCFATLQHVIELTVGDVIPPSRRSTHDHRARNVVGQRVRLRDSCLVPKNWVDDDRWMTQQVDDTTGDNM